MHPALTLEYQVKNAANPPVYPSTELEKQEREKWRALRSLGMGELSLQILQAMEEGKGYTRQDLADALDLSRSTINAAFRLFAGKLGYTVITRTPGAIGRPAHIHYLTPEGIKAKEYFSDLCNG